jgi:hypothetical protein
MFIEYARAFHRRRPGGVGRNAWLDGSAKLDAGAAAGLRVNGEVAAV